MNYVNKYKIIIKSDHLDFMGHVNNATYLQLMEDARWHFYNQYGYTKKMVAEDNRGPVILETYIKYRKEIILGEVIAIKTVCLKYDGVLGKVLQTIYKENGKRSCQAELVFGMFDLTKRKLLRPTGLWKDIHNKMLNILNY